MHSPAPLRTFAAAAALALLLALTACDSQDAPAEPGEVHTYNTRGVVVGTFEGGDMLIIHHEPIDDFVGKSGGVEPMGSHAMPLPLGEGVTAADIEQDDKISFTLHVQWEPEPDFWIDQITQLPGDTQLDLGEAVNHHGHHAHDHDHDHDHAHGHDEAHDDDHDHAHDHSEHQEGMAH